MNEKYNIEGLAKVAKKIVSSCAQHMPMIHLVSKDNEVTICGLGFDSDEAKHKMLDMFRKKVQDEKIPHYFVIIEGWLGNNVHIRPSRDFERREALIICEFKDTMERKTIIMPFTKEDKKIIWEEEISLVDSEQYNMWDFYREDVSAEMHEKHRREALLKEFRETDVKDAWDKTIEQYKKETGKDLPPSFNIKRTRETIERMINEGRVSKRVNRIDK